MSIRRLLALTILAIILLICAIPTQPPLKVAPQQHFLPSVAKQFNPKGVGMAYDYPEDLEELGWFYNWGNNPPVYFGYESVSMSWCQPADFLGGNSKYTLGPNEPNLKGQCDKTPLETARIWRVIEERFPDKLLGSPAPASANQPGTNTPIMGADWLRLFRQAYFGEYGEYPRLDVLTAHLYYWTAEEAIEMMEKYIQIAEEWGIPEIWITEFNFPTGAPDYAPFYRTQEEAWQETEQLMAWVYEHPVVTRWAWFTNRVRGTEAWLPPEGWNTPLVDWNGNLTFWGIHWREL